MELKHSIALARGLTRQLDEALANQDLAQLDDLDAWADLLERRAKALAAFEQAHRQADPAEREAYRREISALVAEDEQLRGRSGEILERMAEEFRERTGRAVSAGPGAGNPLQACFDRKA